MTTGNDSKILLKAIFIVAAILIIRLFYLQILSPQYKLIADENVIKKITIYPSRGLIVDRKGKVIVYNDAVYDILIQLNITENLDTAALANLLEADINYVRTKLNEIKYNTPNKPTPLFKSIDQVLFSKFQEHLYKFPSITIETRTVRRYPYQSGASVLGYLSEVNKDDIIESEGYYEMGDYFGKTGVESYYDEYLRGTKGYTYALVDVKNTYKGKYKDGKNDIQPQAGWDLFTGIDAELQAYGEKLMEGKVGSIVAIEPSTGQILAYISSPTFDPNILTGRYRRQNFNVLFNDEYKPLLNRPINAMYPPGSTFKASTALVMLQEHTHEWNWQWYCPGGYRVGSHFLKCHGSHGIPDVQTALQHSCNSYFCKIYNDFIMDSTYNSPEIGYKKWWNYMYNLGYGKKIGIDLYGEKKGNLPSVEYYNKIFGKGKWRAATIISNSIGQGEVLATPLQIANAMALIANKGFYIQPYIVKFLLKNKTKRTIKKQKIIVGIDPKYFPYVIDGLEKVVQQGTGRVARIEGISFCGKTGTAQNPHGKDHSIFSGFAPKENPKIAIAVFVENAGFGATYAAPIASLMVEKYINDTISKKRIHLQERMIKTVLIKRKVITDTINAKLNPKLDSLLRIKQKNDSIQKLKAKQDSIKNKKVIKPKIIDTSISNIINE